MKKTKISSILIGLLTTSIALGVGTRVDADSTNTMYRLYNPNNHEHFYTANTKERDHLVKIGWGNYEGPAWDAPVTKGNLVYRLYNKGLRDHHYTASWDEVKWLTKNYGWTYEGPAWRSAPKNNHPVYRLFLKGVKTGSHHYTSSWKEVQWLTKNYGWKYEGIGWYGADKTTPTANKKDLQALYNKVKGTTKGNYTDSTWNSFSSALNNAKNILNNSKATQNQVNNAKNKLQTAFNGLKKKTIPTVNKKDLQALYDKVKGTTKSNYTDSTWNSFSSALNNAKNILNNSKATQNQVNDAKNKLQTTFNGLKAKEVQNYTVTVNHIDAQTGEIITSEQSTVKAGTNFTANAKTFKYNENNSNDPTNFDYQVIGNNTQTQQINKDTTITFNYNEVHQITLLCNDNYQNRGVANIIQQKNINVVHGQSVTLTAPTISDYVLDDRVETSNTVTLNNIITDQNYIFNYTHQYTVTVNHVNVDTNEILSSETKTVYEGDSFSAPWKNMTDQNYFLCKNDDPTVTVNVNAMTQQSSRSINDIKQDKTITFKYKNISFDELRDFMRQKELTWLNNYRQQNGVSPMQFNDIVQQAADIRAKELAINFSHYRPNVGGTFQDLLEELGCYGAKGENISQTGLYIDDLLSDNGILDAMLGWKDSPAHNANLLYNNQSILGLGHNFKVDYACRILVDNVFIGANPIFK
ncbi:MULTISPECIES: CAP domain-containing protein [unclassified Enterococcus]|uniref:CAP domain-containing protein n=1 Tax=unclassified Enterococcus TaxID=2608891 RepID=UPI0013E9FF97|nr:MULTISPECIES: CAP domain-containing protein [unclassified Enterococcus]